MSVSDEFVYGTMAEISKLFDIAKQLYYANDTQFNRTIQNQIYLMGKEKGFISEYNYMVGNNTDEKKNEIDVIWRTNNNVIAAFIANNRFNRSTVE